MKRSALVSFVVMILALVSCGAPPAATPADAGQGGAVSPCFTISGNPPPGCDAGMAADGQSTDAADVAAADSDVSLADTIIADTAVDSATIVDADVVNSDVDVADVVSMMDTPTLDVSPADVPVIVDSTPIDTAADVVTARDVPVEDVAPADTLAVDVPVVDTTPPPADVPVPSDNPCPSGQMLCSRGCISVEFNPYNCGACEHVCPARPNATATCSAGSCGISCVTGFGDCDGNPVNGCETDLNTVGDCGSCGHACPAPMGTVARCSARICRTDCAVGYHLCGAACVSNLSPASCGAACMACVPPANAMSTCDGVDCGFSCSPGFTNCSSVCVNVATDRANCGSCANHCWGSSTAGSDVCLGGACVSHIISCHDDAGCSGTVSYTVESTGPGFPTRARPCIGGLTASGECRIEADADFSGNTYILHFVPLTSGGMSRCTTGSCPGFPNGYRLCFRGRCYEGACLRTNYPAAYDLVAPAGATEVMFDPSQIRGTACGPLP